MTYRMIGRTYAAVALLTFAGCVTAPPPGVESAHVLWEIGTADNDTAGFALGRDRYLDFGEDPVFMAGISDPAKDWPYMQPGPDDSWARSRRHTFTIAFAINGTPPEGAYTLCIDLADTHFLNPPQLDIAINGHLYSHQLPTGGSGNSIFGDLSGAQEHCVRMPVDAGDLNAGSNEITITTASGSWILYDWVGFEAPAGAGLGVLEGMTVLGVPQCPPLLVEADGRLFQVVRQGIRHVGEATEATVHVGDAAPVSVTLEPGEQTVELQVPRVACATTVPVEVRVGDTILATRSVVLEPVREWIVYLLPHSHVDIGYTHLQTEVEQRQCQFLDDGIELARQTADHPEGARFKWNSEVLWAVDSYLKQASPEKRDAFIEAVRRGWIGLDALYGNELTALCRPEELIELLGCARRLSTQYGLTIDAAMISDVPGYTWGLVPAMAQSGVKYFSIGPNVGHRIGFTRSAWSDRPFYWVSPSGREKVLCWMAGEGYSWFHRGPIRDGGMVLDYLERLSASGYPYAITYGRYNIGGDNGPPDPDLSAFVQDWNARYAYPKLLIATTSEMFHEFEACYGDTIPAIRGDFTPYWEDGAASSARETAVNRAAAERLVQAGALYAMLDPRRYDADRFHTAWRDVLLYDEHTWGAHNSISEPEGDFAKGQWAIKQAFALDADRLSRTLLDDAITPCATKGDASAAVLVFNTCSWPRTDLVVLDGIGARITQADGQTVPSQRLSGGAVAFLAQDVPPMGAAKYNVHDGDPDSCGDARAEGRQLSNGILTVDIDEATGAIASLRYGDGERELVDRESGPGLNDYLYVAGRNPAEPQRNGPVTIRVKEPGPLVASIEITSEAPGCNALTREVRLVAGLDNLEIVNVIDKTNVYAQEAVHVAFPFRVPEGAMRMDIPWAVVRPEADQVPGSCKNYFTIQRWVDVSNQDYGATWATIDAPLIEVGAITCDPTVTGWLEHIAPSSTLYSYVMNNYWETNYKASQDGPTTFRYAIRPHGRFDAGAAARFGAEQSQPLLAVPVDQDAVAMESFLRVEPAGVVVTALKPSDDGKAWIVRLFGASGKLEHATLTWGTPKQPRMWMSDLTERPQTRVSGPIEIPPYGIVTVRIDR
ncbi:MAG TPA: polysaccharide lyase family protein [Candidatus Bathyarchaeia archaeon]|nr:polysaccharide lyase family protein [Candidatus Bathyarchaeia archaeon]